MEKKFEYEICFVLNHNFRFKHLLLFYVFRVK
jgi:hypothetical protein